MIRSRRQTVAMIAAAAAAAALPSLIMILMVPVLLPVTAAVGIDPVHFGVVVVMNLMIGILTPPFGVALFTVAKVANIPFAVLARAILPFIVPLLLVQIIITYWPALVLYLPRLVYG